MAQNSDVLEEREFSSADFTEFLTFSYYLILLEECKQCSSLSYNCCSWMAFGTGIFREMKMCPECGAYKQAALSNKISTVMSEV